MTFSFLQLIRHAALPGHAVLLAWAGLAGGQAQGQTSPVPSPDWQVCQALADDSAAQLACYQKWAASQTPANVAAPLVTPATMLTTESTSPATATPATQALLLPALGSEAPDDKPVGCRNSRYSDLSRFWELQHGTDCDTFSLRGYRPTSVAVVTSDSINKQPSAPSAGHTALTSQDYYKSESRIQVSVRTKVAKGLLKSGVNANDDQDSLWFGYTTQSYWQVFTPSLSRPFRNTDHEPEGIYIYPHQIALPGGWNYRLSGLGVVHQSNGQSLPLSRSWNRFYLIGAAEKTLSDDASLRLQGRVWNRLRESTSTDDNPGIQDDVGRAELTGTWKINKAHTVGLMVRHSLRNVAHGSTRLDWMISPGGQPSYRGLRYHVQLFSGYGDSLIDYNRKRNVLSVGLSLVDW